MKDKDLFRLAVKILGLVFLYHGLQLLPSGLLQFLASVPNMNFGPMFNSFIMTGWPLVLAYWLLGGAPLLLRIAYPIAPETEKASG